MTFMFNLVVAGNVIDNISQPKWVAIFFQLALALSWLYSGLVVWVCLNTESESTSFDPAQWRDQVLRNFNMAQLFGSATVIFNIL